MKIIRLLGFAILAVILSACGGAAEVVPPTETPIILPATPTSPLPDAATVTPTLPTPGEASPAPSAEPGQYPTVIQLGDPLPDDQPWLLVRISYQEYYLISEDGEHVIEIDPTRLFYENQYLGFVPSPTGEMAAILVTNPELGEDLNLYLWSLRDNSITHITRLIFDHDFSTMASEEWDDYYDIFFSSGDVAWSHDGSKLAFTSAHLGASTDLYVYDLETEEILRLNSGPTKAVNPVWSPDDAYILHAGVDRLYIGYSGRGYEGWQFYSAAPDGSELHTLAAGKLEERGDEDYLGWVSDRQMLMHSGYWWCGYFDLRMMDIISGEEDFVWRGNYDYLAYSPEIGLALMYISPIGYIDEPYCGVREKDPGLYLLTIPDGKLTEVPLDGIEGDYFEVEIINGEMPFYLIDREQRYTLDLEGNIEEFSGDPYLPEQFWDLDIEIDYIYGWVSSVGMERE